MPKHSDPKIKHVSWRGGRPRFEPSATLRARGHKGHDLKTEDGARWMTAGEALEWSRAFTRRLAQAAEGTKAKRAPRRTPEDLPSIAPSFPLSALFDEWLSPPANPQIKTLGEKTIYEYRLKARVLQKRLPDAWAAEAAAFTRPICVGMYDALLRDVGVAQAVSTMRVLGIAFQWAIRRGRIAGMEVNPAHELGMTAPPPRIRVGTIEEIRHLVAVADQLGRPEIGDMIVLGVWSGQRQSDRRMMTVAKRENGRLVLQQMKTRARVSIPEAPAVKARLAASEQRRREAGVINPHVVLDERRWTPFTQTHYAHVFAQIRKIAATGQPETDTMPAIAPMPSLLGEGDEDNPLSLRDQDLRDTAVTWLARAGCSIPEICAITGHSLKSATTIFKHYLAIDPAMADTAMAKMVAWYDEEGEGK
ncbi:hypothetical protein [Rhizobium sp. SGZ-381]|uniref:hypothetical protein n=1 Tax=Rhizobium sp. SGZ-381 TaxID=3342800 RepID=UPI00366CE7AF